MTELLPLLPDIVWQHVASFLPTPFSLLCVSQSINAMSLDESFWKMLLRRDDIEGEGNARELRQAFLTGSYIDRCKNAKWYSVDNAGFMGGQREGHAAFVLNQQLCLTGGFTDDTDVYCKNLQGIQNQWESRTTTENIRHHILQYGASYTVVGNRIIVIGGFTAGGYQGETAAVRILEPNRNAFVLSDPIATKRDPSDEHPVHLHDPFIARAYHTASLIDNRYILIIGGMQSEESILNPAILDTETWIWKTEGIVTQDVEPSPRHGHSAIVDFTRDRIVIFGGGDGHDLLRSGSDNTEIWELLIPRLGQDQMKSMPWHWRQIKLDKQPTTLEALNLGRCHGSYKVSKNKVILLFGSGRPSTNRVMSFDFNDNSLQEVSTQGPFPGPRFTFASVLLPDGYIFCHGGFDGNRGRTYSDAWLLDLAPELERPVRLFSVNERARSAPLTTEEDIPRSMTEAEFMGILRELSRLPPALRRLRVIDRMTNIQREGINIESQYEMFLSMIAMGMVDVNDIFDQIAADHSEESDNEEFETVD